jgi:hypothetical protein
MIPRLQQQGRKVQPFSDDQLMRAAQAVELIEHARAGNPEALRVIGKVRTLPHGPGSPHHLDLMALDAAQITGPGDSRDDDDYLEQLVVEGLGGTTGAIVPVAATPIRVSNEIITADRLRAALDGGRSCGCP